MNDFVQSSAMFGVVISLVGYEIGIWIQRKSKLQYMNPLLVSIILVMLFLKIGDIDYSSYQNSAKYLSYLLTPATVCLAIPMYEKLQLLKKNIGAIFGGVFIGTVTSLLLVFGIAILCNMTKTEYITLLPKSITTAIGMGVVEKSGGYIAIIVPVIILTGISGNVTAEWGCKVFKITNPIAKGVAIGTSAHALGTARAIEMGKIEGAMSSLAIVVAGIMTVILAPVFEMLVK